MSKAGVLERVCVGFFQFFLGPYVRDRSFVAGVCESQVPVVYRHGKRELHLLFFLFHAFHFL